LAYRNQNNSSQVCDKLPVMTMSLTIKYNGWWSQFVDSTIQMTHQKRIHTW